MTNSIPPSSPNRPNSPSPDASKEHSQTSSLGPISNTPSNIQSPNTTSPISLKEQGKKIEPFTVSELNQNEKSSVIKELEKWAISAQEKYEKDPDSPILKDHRNLCQEMFGVAKSPELSNYAVLVCRDLKGNIQAIAIYDKNDDEVGGIITHPNNIDHPLNKNLPGRMRGAGSAIAIHEMQDCLARNKNLKLVALPSAFPFYEKLGFEHEYDQSRRMVLTIEKIRTILGFQSSQNT